MRLCRLIPLLVLLLAGCGGEPDDPEARLRATMAEAERAVEQRAIKQAAGYISPEYHDDQGRTDEAVRQLLAGYMVRNRNIHLFSRIAEVQLDDNGKAAGVRLYVAMAGVPIRTVEALVSVRADLYRFDLRFIDGEEGWRLVGAVWQQASIDDLLD